MALNHKQRRIVRQAKEILRKELQSRSVLLGSSQAAQDFFELHLQAVEREHFLIAFLDNQNHLIEAEVMFSGTLNECPVFPREIAKRSLGLNARSIIIGHNHPSGNNHPSESDKTITEEIANVMQLVGVRVLDHLIVGNDVTSFAELGLL